MPEIPVLLNPSYWDSMTWDSFTWDGRSLNPVEVGIDGSGENVALTVYGESAKYDSFTINSFTVGYSPRRFMR